MDEGLAGLAAGYGFAEPAVGLGRAVKGEEVATGFEVAVPLAMLNRHGLVAGGHRHRQDQDRPGPGRAAVGRRRALLRGRHEG
jgi:hypothetical protein